MMQTLCHSFELSQLTLPSPLSTLYGIVGHFPDKALFQLEETPVVHHGLVRAIQTAQQKIGQYGQCDRACHTLLVASHLHAAQVQTTLELLYGEFHPPASRVDTENGARGCPREIGHDDFDLCRPTVTPFLGQYKRDIAQLMQRGVAHKHPEILSTTIRFGTRPALVVALGHVLHQVPEGCASGKLPGARHCQNLSIALFRSQTQGRMGGKARIRHDHDRPRPAWGHKGLPHLPEQDGLMPFDLWINGRQRHRHTKACPTGKDPYHLKATDRGIMFAMARRVPQGRFSATLLFHRALPDHLPDPVRWGRKRSQGCRRHLRHGRCGIPLARPDHPQGRPIGKLQRQIGSKPLARPFSWIADHGHQQPAEDQKVLRLGAIKVSLERVEHLLYGARDACETPHVLRSSVFWEVGDIQNTQERFFFQVLEVMHPSLRSTHPSLLSE